MFDKLINSLFGSAPKDLPPEDARVALTALLVRIARSDGDYDEVEKDKIRQVVAERYAMPPELAQDLMYQAQELEAQAPDTVRFTEAIKDAVPYDERIEVVSAAWRVVLADGNRADEEDALMRLIAKFLGVSDRDSNIARQKATG